MKNNTATTAHSGMQKSSETKYGVCPVAGAFHRNGF